MSGKLLKKQRKLIIYSLTLILLVFAIDTGFKAYSQTQRRNEIKEVENFHRPEPTRPISPEIPGVNRYQDDKIFLEYADSLYKIESRDTIEKQILKGNVKFRQSGLWMFCDSAYYYPQQNSLDAFSNVRMEQGDTLFVYADKLFYNGDIHLAKLKNGPTREKVTMINNDVTLTTDSLDYDMEIDLGWYLRWGTINDKVNTLTSLYGQYSPKTKQAEFFTDVVLVNDKDGFTLLTDTLYYSTETHIANIESPAEIQSENDTIITRLATYYTDTGDADLLSRSMIIHKDSTGNVTTLEGDSIIYDSKTRISRAYMFADPFKSSTPMVITDTAQKTTLIGGFGIYNDSTKEALATIYPLLMEYSQGDTLFLRADTIKTFIITEMVADKRWKTKSGFPEFKGMPIVMADSTGIWIDSLFFELRIPYVETPFQMLRNVAPLPEEQVSIPVEQDIISKEQEDIPVVQEIIPEEQEDIPVVQEIIPEEQEEIPLVQEIIPVEQEFIPEEQENIPAVQENILQTDSLLNPVQNENLLIVKSTEELTDTIDTALLPDSIPQETHIVFAYHRARFFKKDMQGVADSIVFVEKDSMLYMFRKPIIWSGERQVTGNRIDVHFNDSTTDWAYLPEFGLMSEYVDEDFYNQIYGKEITAYFEGEGLRRMYVSGNVETIFLPQEEDSTFNRLVNAESSYMDVYMDENKLDWMKMWPEVSGTVTPIFLVKRSQMYLQKFKWWSFLRPKREWYGDEMRWDDNLGEVPEDLEQYFLMPSDFGEPKSFTGPRIIVPPTSLPEINDSLINELDSLSNLINEIQLPESVATGIDSEGIEKVESTETLEDIEKGEEEEEKEVEDVEAQTEDIEDNLKEEDNSSAILKEEEEDE